MTRDTKTRVIIDICVFLSVFIFPWWLTVAALIILLFRYTNYYEALVAGLILDSIYGVESAHFGGYRFVITTVMVLLFVFLLYFKRFLSFSR